MLVTIKVNQHFVLSFLSMGRSLGLCFEYEYTGNVCCRWFDGKHLVIRIHRRHIIRLFRWSSFCSTSSDLYNKWIAYCPLAILRWPIWHGNCIFGPKACSFVHNYSRWPWCSGFPLLPGTQLGNITLFLTCNEGENLVVSFHTVTALCCFCSCWPN